MNAALCTEVLYPLYGVERRVYEMAQGLPKYGFDTVVFTSSSPKHFPSLAVNQVSDHTISAPPKRNYVSCLKYVTGLYSRLTSEKFDVIDANGHLSLIPCSIAARKTKTPVVATLHDLYLTQWHSMYKGKAAVFGLPFELVSSKMYFDKIIVLNSSIKSKLVNILRIPEERIEIIPSGIDTRELDKIKSKKRENEVLFAGRLVPQKNVDILLRAFSLINDARLTIIGEGTEKQNLITLAGKLHVADRIKFINPVSRSELIKRMRSAAVFVMPSRRENFGITPLEAMYCGTATISTNTEGPKDYIESGRNGMLVNIGDVNHLAEGIEKILADKQLRTQLENNGRKTAKSYDWENIIKKIAYLYKDVI